MPSSKSHRKASAIGRNQRGDGPTRKQIDLLKALSKRLRMDPPFVSTKAEASREIANALSLVDAETGRSHIRSMRDEIR